MKKRINVLLIICLLSVTVLIDVNTPVSVAANNKTIGQIHGEMSEYMKENHPEIKIDSEKYIEFLTEQLMTGADKVLAQKANYDGICQYAGEYLRIAQDKSCANVAKNDIIVLDKLEKEIGLEKVMQRVQAQEWADMQAALQYTAQTEKLAKAAKTNYNASAAVKYARKWAKSNNNAYDKFSNDCTNFVSQAALAGGAGLKKPAKVKHGIYDTTTYWYSIKHKFTGATGRVSNEYDVTTSWIRVSDFYTYALKHNATVTTYPSLSKLQANCIPGDIVQLKKNKSGWYHSIIITGGKKGDRTFCGHTRNRLDYKLSKLDNNTSFRVIRFK